MIKQNDFLWKVQNKKKHLDFKFGKTLNQKNWGVKYWKSNKVVSSINIILKNYLYEYNENNEKCIIETQWIAVLC